MEPSSISARVLDFSGKFIGHLDQQRNVVASPLSAEFLLALLTLGTTDPAHEELISCLGVPSDDDIRNSFKSIAGTLKSIKGVTLTVGNKVYVKEGLYDLQTELKDDAVKVFDSDFEKVDFSKSDAAANLINKWVENRTNEKIKNLLSPDILDDATRLVLINAIYFKGNWKHKFDLKNTKQEPFFVNNETVVQVPMMYKEAECKYGNNLELGVYLLEMPYEGDEASMLFVVPEDVNGISNLLKNVKLMSAIKNTQLFQTKVQVSIPRFKIETKIDLKEVLQNIGIKAIFNENNSGLTKVLNNKEDVYVSAAVQKACIEVNEEGSEAAAASAMVIMTRSAPMMPSFRADRPFLYMLLGPGRIPYFVGVYRGK